MAPPRKNAAARRSAQEVEQAREVEAPPPVPRECNTTSQGLMDIARHVLRCHVSQETSCQNAFDDVAGNRILLVTSHGAM